MVDVGMLLGGLASILVFGLLLLLIKLRAEKSLQPKEASEGEKTFDKLKFGSTTVEAKITWKDRPKEGANMACTVLLYVMILAQFAIGVTLIGLSKAKLVSSGPCPEGMVSLTDAETLGYDRFAYERIPKYCVEESVRQQYEDLNCRRHDFRRLSVNEPVQHGRILFTNDVDGNVQAAIQHDLYSALAIMADTHVETVTSLSRRLQGTIRFAPRTTHSSSRATSYDSLFGLFPTCQGDDCVESLWDAFTEHVQVPSVLLAVIVVLVPLWLLALKMLTGPVVWFTLLLDLALLIYLTIRSQFQFQYFVAIAVFVCLVVLLRNKIFVAIEMLRIATEGLGQNPGVFAACFVVWLLYAAYVALWMMVLISTPGVVGLVGCELQPLGFVGNATTFMIVMFMPTTFYFMNCKLVVCACGLGAWYFHADDPQKPRSPAFVGLKWAFYDSAGPTFVASLIQYAVHELRTTACSWVWWCHPFGCFLRALWCCIEHIVRAFTKFMLLGHVFHGGAVIKTATNVFAVLRNQLGEAIVTDVIAVSVVWWSTVIFSLGLGFAGWSWMDTAIGRGVLHEAVMGGGDLMVVGLSLCLLYFCSMPLTTLVLVIGFCQKFLCEIMDNRLVGFVTAIFIACITTIVFSFVGGIVHNSTDTIMYCVALEKETGRQQERFQCTYETLKKHGVMQGTVAGGEGVVTGTEIGDTVQWPDDAAERA